jgi:hypothetical protein
VINKLSESHFELSILLSLSLKQIFVPISVLLGLFSEFSLLLVHFFLVLVNKEIKFIAALSLDSGSFIFETGLFPLVLFFLELLLVAELLFFGLVLSLIGSKLGSVVLVHVLDVSLKTSDFVQEAGLSLNLDHDVIEQTQGGKTVRMVLLLFICKFETSY